eukprot:CAMPEP_0195284788 /NCGR_PEP_ID=MMETSP0707-20130614/2869_1 /TAXON_ID=33640 /ORGANISM="Asterionellopsis glacialis, Strain CCMP134" /LENGTH=265 /DNA_ID=CAMNT_0040344185 /DNA_START=173 /DNA_END=970 /DNA_ORIENTATION=+
MTFFITVSTAFGSPLNIKKTQGKFRSPSMLEWSTPPFSFQRKCVILQDSKWDNLVDEDEEDEGPPVPPNMRYTPSNLIRQKNNYDAIRDAGGKEMVNDIYIREVGSETFWFIGKVARISDVSVEDTISKQWPLIQMHAGHLRPIELFPSRNKNEIWYAPGDSELDVAYYRPNVTFVKVDRNVEGVKAIKVNFVGFEGETYTQDEDGFRTLRTDDGKPAKPEVMGADDGGSNRAPTAEEMADLEKALIDQGLGDVLDTNMGDVLEQ